VFLRGITSSILLAFDIILPNQEGATALNSEGFDWIILQTESFKKL
jgi:hypothetical protein